MLIRNIVSIAPKFKLHHYIAEKVDLMGAHYQIPPKVLLIHDIRTFYHCPIQDLRTFEMSEAFDALYEDRDLKPQHQHREIKGLTHVRHMLRDFQMKWIRFILSRVHEMQLQLDQLVRITKKMIHQVIGFPMMERAKATKNLPWVELTKKTNAKWDDRGMKLHGVIDMEIRFAIHVIAHKIYRSNRKNSVPCEAVDLAYKITKNHLSFDLVELQLVQMNKNLESIQVAKPNPWKYDSLLVCLFFYIHKFFPSKGVVVWKKDRPVVYQINEYIVELGDNFESIMDAYFEDFKERMQSRYRIPKQLVEEYEKDICFLVDCDKVHIQAVQPRVAWVKPLSYEVNINETRDIIEALINEPINPKAIYFGTYEEAKDRITVEIKIPQILKRGRKTVDFF